MNVDASDLVVLQLDAHVLLPQGAEGPGWEDPDLVVREADVLDAAQAAEERPGQLGERHVGEPEAEQLARDPRQQVGGERDVVAPDVQVLQVVHRVEEAAVDLCDVTCGPNNVKFN